MRKRVQMKLCPDCEPETSCCDFCKHYDFNGLDNGGRHGVLYTGAGFCKLTKEQRDPGDCICDDFYCGLANL